MENNRKIWFKRKLYGWGWYPASREGWLVTVVYMTIIVFLALATSEGADTKEWWLFFVLPVTLLTVSFIADVERAERKQKQSFCLRFRAEEVTNGLMLCS
ncbi:MAG: hypothetical protein WDZ73_01320 [Candidatus Paceibacterota bacterium]